MAAILASSTVFASCAGDTGAADETTSAQATETTEEVTTELTDSVPEMSFDGREFHLATSRADYYTGQVTADEQNGDVLNDAMYERTKKIEERFDINFVDYPDKGKADIIRTAVTAGDAAYDLALLSERTAISLGLDKLIVNINDIPYIDLDQPWWVKDLNDQMTIGGQLYIAYSDLSLTSYDFTNTLIFNKRIAEDFNMENFYDMVREGTWTYDAFNKYASMVVQDVNGDGKQDKGDVVGIYGTRVEIVPAFWIGAGAKSIHKDEDDIPHYTLPGDEYFQNVYDKMFEILIDNGAMYLESYDNKMFKLGQSLFSHALFSSIDGYRDFEDDFGLLPYPKLNETQESYYSRVGAGVHTVTVPATADLEFTGAIVEATACASYFDITPVYYEVALKEKYTRDNDTAEMLDLIMSCRTCDMGDTYWNNYVRQKLAPMVEQNNRNLASFAEATRNSVQENIDSVVEMFLG